MFAGYRNCYDDEEAEKASSSSHKAVLPKLHHHNDSSLQRADVRILSFPPQSRFMNLCHFPSYCRGEEIKIHMLSWTFLYTFSSRSHTFEIISLSLFLCSRNSNFVIMVVTYRNTGSGYGTLVICPPPVTLFL